MKKFLIIFTLVFALTSFFTVAIAVDTTGGAGGESTGSILDYLGISTGCTAPTAPCSEDAANGLFAAVACKVTKAFNQGVIPLYCNIVSNPNYLAAIDGAMMLYVILLGFSFMFGFLPMTAGNLVAKLLKATIVYALIINADLFFSLIYNTTLQTPQDAVRIMLGADTGRGSGSGAQNFFQYVDKGMHQIFSSTTEDAGSPGSGQTYTKTNLKIFMMGLAIWQLGGDLIGGVFFAVVAGWIINYFSIMIRYLLAMLSLMFVLMLGPIFIPTLLFEQSKYIGEEWINLIISFILQIVLVVAFVLMVQGFFIDFYDMIKKGIESPAVMSQSKKNVLVGFDMNDASGNNHAYRNQENSAYTAADAEKYFTQVFGADYRQKLPQMVFKLIEMMIIVTFTSMFMQVVPSLAALLIGNARFVRLFSGISFGAKDKLYQANLLGNRQGQQAFNRFTLTDEGEALEGISR